MTRTSTAIALVASLVATPAFAATWTYEQLDQDSNLEVSEVEFQRYSADLIERWDTDGDSRLSAAEFQNSGPELGLDMDDPFTSFDANDDDFLAEDELGTGLYDAYDLDRDGVLAEAEYAEAEERVGGMDNTVLAQEIIELSKWRYDPLYTDGISAERLIDDMDVYGVDGEEIGSTENLLIGPDGRVLALIAEVGGFWDMGDTHVSIPWDMVEVGEDGVVVPVTEDTVGDYSLYAAEYVTADLAANQIQEVDGDGWGEVTTGPRVWRVDEFIGDYTRLTEGNEFQGYGYVSDVIIRDGQIGAVIVSPDVSAGAGGPYAYPYSRWGWGPDSPYYDLPYEREEVGELERFDYERMGAGEG